MSRIISHNTSTVDTPDFDAITTPTEIVLDGHHLWVTPGATREGGRYWALATASGHIKVGVVAEHHVQRHGRTYTVFTAASDSLCASRPTAEAAAHRLAATLGGAR